jgi:hypothetical protein
MEKISHERRLIMVTHFMPGNTGIQYAVAHIISHFFKFTKFEIVEPDTIYANVLICNDNLWSQMYPFLEGCGDEAPLRYRRMMEVSIYMYEFFQDSVPLVKNRNMIRERFRAESAVISRSGYTVSQFATAESPIALQPDDVVLHVRLGDFELANLVIDPAPQLRILRALKPKRLIIVCQRPKTDAEKNYLLFFEEFRPVFQHGTELEDFATLRSAKRIIVSNSTFSWLAAFLGDATERWIPEPTYNSLGRIDESDHLYEAANGYSLGDLAIPTEPFLPVTGEFLQSLCEYTVLDREKVECFHVTIDYAAPRDRQLFIEESWPAKVFEAKSLFIYPTEGGKVGRHVFAHSWPNLRLIVLHNSDFDVDYEALLPFLEANPAVYVWAQNSILWHARLRPVPIGEENRMWRGGSADHEPLVSCSRSTERDIDIMVPHWSDTNPVRKVWHAQALARSDLTMMPKLQKADYLERVTEARALVCPPGNGIDTHRCWDALTKGAWAVVQDNMHTKALLEQYPSLHLIPVGDMTCPIDLPEGIPPFHPLLLRPFWRTLFKSYA